MAEFEEIDVHQAKVLIEKGDVRIIDVRSEDAFGEGHIEGAINVNNDNIDEFVKKTDKGQPVLCYCYKGFSSQKAAQYLKDQGFQQVYSMAGGYMEWQNDHESGGS